MSFRFCSLLPLLRACCLLLFLVGSGSQSALAGTETCTAETRQAVAATSRHPAPYLCQPDLLHQEALAPAQPECAPSDAGGPALLPWPAAATSPYGWAAALASVPLPLLQPAGCQQRRCLLLAVAPNAP